MPHYRFEPAEPLGDGGVGHATMRSRVVQAEDYRWSGATDHDALRTDAVLTPDTGFPPPGRISDWSAWLQTGLTREETAHLRHATQRGLPCGSETFIRSEP